MSMTEASVRGELLDANDETIEDAVTHADPMVMRALLYQLTGDPELVSMALGKAMAGYSEITVPATAADLAMLRRKAVEFLKAYRDAGAGEISPGPKDRLPTSLSLVDGVPVADDALAMVLEELALDPWARSLRWQEEPDKERLQNFKVILIGSGMGGLNAALQLKRAGIPYTMIEKNAGVGGTWHENRYPGARVDTPSRSYTHLFGVDYIQPNPYCTQDFNEGYFNWVADTYGLRENAMFNTEVHSMTWDEETATWDVTVLGPDGEQHLQANAVMTAVGFLNRPSMPDIEGIDEFEGQSWHTARWPEDSQWRGKRIAVIGTGASGYQMIPEIVVDAGHVTIFQRSPSWLVEVRGYRQPFPPQATWLDRNFPYYTNFLRFRYTYGPDFHKINTIDPDFAHPDACSPTNKLARDACIDFLERKLGDPELVKAMTPNYPLWAARPVRADPEWSILDAIKRDDVTLVTSGIKRINQTGIEGVDGRQHDVDVIIYATGFRANDYLFPMKITGRDGKTIEQLWAEGGARAYAGCMMPGFPNLFSVYGPNTNGALTIAAFHEMIVVFALQCMEKLILTGQRSVDVKEEAYWRYNDELDARNRQKVWSDPRTHNYYWSKHGRSTVQNPFNGPEMWALLRHPHFEDLDVRR